MSGFRAAVRLSGHLASTTRDICDRSAIISPPRSIPSHALAMCRASNGPPCANTAQAMRASLLASATTTMFL